MGSDKGRPVAEELRARAGAFVNSHVDLWVAVEDEGTLVLAGNDARALFQAAADWLGQGRPYDVADVRWERRPEEPTQALRIRLAPEGTAEAGGTGTANGTERVGGTEGAAGTGLVKGNRTIPAPGGAVD